MVKTILIHLENKDYERLKKAKGKLSWHDFVMTLVKPNKDKEGEKDK